MSSLNKDPLGKAIQEFAKTSVNKDVIVRSEICDDDIIPSAYLFRSFDEMPEIEQVALKNCKGSIIDVGAGAGIHAKYLVEKGHEVACIDISPLAIEHLNAAHLNAREINFYDLKGETYDTVLMLMNGIGIAGTLSNLRVTLEKAKSLLNKGGKILCDSSDIKYLYEDEDGAMWVDLNSEYYGNFKFQMVYDEQQTDWFPWLYVDANTLEEVALSEGLSTKILVQNEHEYLAELTPIDA